MSQQALTWTQSSFIPQEMKTGEKLNLLGYAKFVVIAIVQEEFVRISLVVLGLEMEQDHVKEIVSTFVIILGKPWRIIVP